MRNLLPLLYVRTTLAVKNVARFAGPVAAVVAGEYRHDRWRAEPQQRTLAMRLGNVQAGCHDACRDIRSPGAVAWRIRF